MEHRISLPLERMEAHYDVVVVGSGYGASIAAARMANARKPDGSAVRVAVLERGREMRPGEYPDTLREAAKESQIHRHHKSRGNPLGLFDFNVNRGMSALVGCGLGGTSLINANVARPPHANVLQHPKWPTALRGDPAGELHAGMQRAMDMLNSTPYPTGKEGFPPLPKYEALAKAGAALKTAAQHPHINVTFRDGPNAQGLAQRACVGCGNCVTGCNAGAKNTTLMNYLQDAADHGAHIFTHCRVRTVRRAKGSRGGDHWVVAFDVVDPKQNRYEAPPNFVMADLVVLAAGTLGSTEILLRSRRDEGLQFSGRLGEGFSGNGDVLAFGYDCAPPIRGIGFRRNALAFFGAAARNARRWLHLPRRTPPPAVGPCITGIIDRRTGDLGQDHVIEEGSVPGALSRLMGIVLRLADRSSRRDEAGDRSPVWRRASRFIARAVRRGKRKNHTQTYLVMAHDDAEGDTRTGTLRLDGRSDRLRIEHATIGYKEIFKSVDHELADATERALQGRRVRDPIWSRFLDRSMITVHPLGGCPMADDATAGVVDDCGRVFRGSTGTQVHEGLVVADGSIVPISLGINPLLTISGLAERAMVHLAKDRGWTLHHEPTPTQGPLATVTPVGFRFTERMSGPFDPTGIKTENETLLIQRARRAGTHLTAILTVDVPNLAGLTARKGNADVLRKDAMELTLTGTVTVPSIARTPLRVTKGSMWQFVRDPTRADAQRMDYELHLVSEEGATYFLTGFKRMKRGHHLWRETTTLHVWLHAGDTADGPLVGQGVLRIGLRDFLREMRSMTVVHVRRRGLRLRWWLRFNVVYFMGRMWAIYGGPFRSSRRQDPAAARPTRPLTCGPPRLQEDLRADDGGLLRLTRYAGPSPTSGPVLLVHGAGVSSRIFSTDLVGVNLVEHLVDEGYDVWLLDTRFSIDRPGAPWTPNADVSARYDIPAGVREILRRTGAEQVDLIAHCYGATVTCMALAAGHLPQRQVRSLTLSQVGLHPIPPWLTRLKAWSFLPNVLGLLGIRHLTAASTKRTGLRGRLLDGLLRFTPAPPGEACTSPICRRTRFLFGGLWKHSNLPPDLHDHLHELFGPASMGTLRHLARMVRHGEARPALGRPDAYLGTTTWQKLPGGRGVARNAQLERLAIPTLILHGEDNGTWAQEATQRTLVAVAEPNDDGLYKRFVVPGYGHLDCIFGKHAHRDVFPHITSHLDSRQTSFPEVPPEPVTIELSEADGPPTRTADPRQREAALVRARVERRRRRADKAHRDERRLA